MNYCPNCGNPLGEHAKFCGKCGSSLNLSTQPVSEVTNETTKKPGLFSEATRAIGKYAGEEDGLKVDLNQLFSEVTKKHTNEEAEKIFIAGTKQTTPDISKVTSDWSKPWLFSRIFIAALLVFGSLLIAVTSFENSNAIPGLIIIGAFAVPFSVLIFFFETNVYQNISIFEVIKIFFIGGVISILSTLFLYEFVTFSDETTYFGVMTITDAFLVSVVEELGKAVIVVYFINKYSINKILNGLLIGAAVGAGFAAFETSGYVFTELLGYGDVIGIIVLRGWMSIGTHLAWSAMIGGAVIIVKKTSSFNINQLFDTRFIFFFASAVVLHGIWDMGIVLLNSELLIYILLIVAAWIELFILMSAGLKEVNQFRQTEN
ncbi:PrsW family glutamic-type intramembrane protease [Candidatus Enterococcus ferrettii]|uniref:Zinc-ribbon domain-containing protein n=1 Tax=Candidatus Enterococcus ferrettii TaxID=2815324 RepID=A0ABV0EM96_9ENTE|nr:PrsW family intramembrane metalloprotease [Enterococcus sp. 665A]MBO1342707.1 PrsW family intramembrane metalloprotease [Enterococcus sp. 665A]